ncbi:MAG TPA: serine protease, partial [Micromonosporaceae bacterium]|nr:serine protease [Micromonosporaceae bacterium]
HPSYSTQYDIAVIKLASPSAKTPIAIGSASPGPNTAVRLLGWGQTCAPRGCSTGAPIGLKQLDTTILNDSSCQGLNSSNELCVHGTTTNTACYGDSGGPALVGSGTSWTLVGATSRSGDNNTTCGTGNAIYEDVVAFKSWIDSVTGDDPPPSTGCTGYAKTYTGTLSAGGSQIQPTASPGYFYTANSGQHKVCLDGPSGVDFDLYLQKWNGSSWANVATSDSPNPDEAITYNGTSGYYRYRVLSYSGSGGYTLGATNP